VSVPGQPVLLHRKILSWEKKKKKKKQNNPPSKKKKKTEKKTKTKTHTHTHTHTQTGKINSQHRESRVVTGFCKVLGPGYIDFSHAFFFLRFIYYYT
jgi:ribosomal protein S25